MMGREVSWDAYRLAKARKQKRDTTLDTGTLYQLSFEPSS